MAENAKTTAEPSKPMFVTSRVVFVLILVLSIQPMLNLLSPDQIMNTSYDPFNLVNTYGAFGSVGQERLNIVFEGTMDSIPTDSAVWKEYPYKALPVALDKRPPQVAPYQLHLDWQMWFASMSTPDEYPWTLTLISKLLHNDPGALSLFAANPFPDKPPRYIRAILYRYKFMPPGNLRHLWWSRQQIGAPWLPAMAADDPRLKQSQ